MASSYTTNLGIESITTGEQSGALGVQPVIITGIL